MTYHQGIAILDRGDALPDPATGPKQQPIAIGFELTPELMLEGYRKGLFAWSSNPVTWWSPDPRAIMPLDGMYVSTRLARKIRNHKFAVTIDQAFDAVVVECAKPRDADDGVWLTEDFRKAYNVLAETGYAHSVECWQDGELVGGVFGIQINNFFAAETMFHKATDASKIALFHLTQYLRATGVSLLDIQVLTSHTARLGAREISRQRYLNLLRRAVA